MSNQDKVSIQDFYKTLISTDFSKADPYYLSCKQVLAKVKNYSLSSGDFDSTEICILCPFSKDTIYSCHFLQEKYVVRNKLGVGKALIENKKHLIPLFRKQLIKEFPNLLLEEKERGF